VTETVNEIQYIIKKYITGLFIQMVIVSVLMVLTLSILGVKYAILLGLVAGIFNIIPYLGISIALIISVLITFATAGATKALFVLFAYAGVHTIDGNILMPLIVGSKVKINALIAFIGIVIGEMLCLQCAEIRLARALIAGDLAARLSKRYKRRTVQS
ncbi:MAG: AI-2E family transporter, partial [Flavobacterium sp.]